MIESNVQDPEFNVAVQYKSVELFIITRESSTLFTPVCHSVQCTTEPTLTHKIEPTVPNTGTFLRYLKIILLEPVLQRRGLADEFYSLLTKLNCMVAPPVNGGCLSIHRKGTFRGADTHAP